jgi:hypothetical protein
VILLRTTNGEGRFEGNIDPVDWSRLEPYLRRRPDVYGPPAAPGPSAPVAPASAADPVASRRTRLAELRGLYEDGLIPQHEYQRRCAEILAEI